ncbi:2-aminoethylphosphonate--pyruvate transaminase [Paenibacillus sp. GCM10012307]|uniref:2-aminoethylphosphonate--pyruvate transaminase n=1 Tax=Paenibacillus roseus TaxID=2798579 RepID=A0A934J263_9BACL|nr:2-aminoethylphosphonate--pyruvate transaminase [Paenibacillus roseus]MBJ6360078.1 2-aminoethylphosphonate--pyruvate transaminase [Paenibacillus roseus]
MSNPYLLLTPGPLSTTSSVKEAMLKDWCTWDDDYKQIVQSIRSKLLQVGQVSEAHYTTVFMQGSGTFGVEAAIGTAVPADGKLLILVNGAYGTRMQDIAKVLGIRSETLVFAFNQKLDVEQVNEALERDDEITHVAFVHCETSTGILNPIDKLMKVIKRHRKIAIVDAMSSFGGIPIAVEDLGIDYVISSANKCIQGVPGFSFILCRISELAKCEGRARSLSLDVYDQWRVMDSEPGKWRFTSPTHVVRAFHQALIELEQEGGVEKRHERYVLHQLALVSLMEKAGFATLLPKSLQSPIITTFKYPLHSEFTFESFYRFLKEKGFVIYPGKLSEEHVFRIGTIGDISMEKMIELGKAVSAYVTDIMGGQ